IPNIDINITFTGLRPGEKLYEELLNDAENVQKTYHEKIMIAKVRTVVHSNTLDAYNHFVEMVNQPDKELLLVAKMKELVPEFISNNSVYESLDQMGKVVNL
ncbi:MAG: polysaccharide biosynthesis protein, partial [Sediminibacterium sp.]